MSNNVSRTQYCRGVRLPPLSVPTIAPPQSKIESTGIDYCYERSVRIRTTKTQTEKNIFKLIMK